jgi:hypothetical protein
MSQIQTKENIIKQLDEIIEAKGKRQKYSDNEIDEVTKLCQIIEDNAHVWNDFQYKGYFEGHLFTYAKFKDFRKRYLQTEVAAVSKTSEPSPKLIDVEPKQQPKKEKQKTGRPPNEVNRVRFATYIDEDLNKKVRIYAAYNELKLNDVIEEALREYFKSKTINVNI